MSATPPARQAPSTADEVVALLRRICAPLEPERVPLDDALGRVLRDPLRAPDDQPPFDRSSMDGYAIRLDDRSPRFRVVDEIRAGDWKPRTLAPGEAVRIATGGALPDAGLQVIMREDVVREGEFIVINDRDDERHIRFRGEDAKAGQVLADTGTLLRPGTLSLLASVGHTQPLVTRLPRVLHAATGNEIVPPDQKPANGQIRDSNSSLVRGFLTPWHIRPVQLRVPEDEAAARTALEAPGREADLILISGGASVGEHDFTRRLLESFGFVIQVSRTNARPGKPLVVAQRGRSVAFGLPGNPLAHFVCLNLYVRAALESWAGRTAGDLATFQPGRLGADLPADGNTRETFWPARRSWRDGEATLIPLRWSSSGDLTSLAAANALIRVAAAAERLQNGQRVEYIGAEECL